VLERIVDTAPIFEAWSDEPWVKGFELSRGPQRQWIIDFGNEVAEDEADHGYPRR
jgi:hypothetical protein